MNIKSYDGFKEWRGKLKTFTGSCRITSVCVCVYVCNNNWVVSSKTEETQELNIVLLNGIKYL